MDIPAPAPIINVYPLSNYTLHDKDPKIEKDYSVAAMLQRMRKNYRREGRKNTVEGIFVVHEHNHPHVLLLKRKTANFYKLPGGKLRPGENETEGLKRKLSSKLAEDIAFPQPDWQIGEVVSVWWRPNFERVLYPYCAPHITMPKECRKLFIVQLPQQRLFYVPTNFTLICVPLFELYDNAQTYGPVLSTIPQMLSRVQLNLQ